MKNLADKIPNNESTGNIEVKHEIEQLLRDVDVHVNGNHPWDVKIHDPRVLDTILYQHSIGGGEAYMDGWWDCDKLDELFYRICRNKSERKFYSTSRIALTVIKNSLINQQTPKRSEDVANTHYNLGNRLFELMLGKSMAYTCGYWKEAKTLDEAQFAKYDLVCRKAQLKPGEKVLEIGCGWGGLAKYMAEQYGCQVVGMDIAKEPASYAKELCKDLPVEIYHCDYRSQDVYNSNNVQFDKIVSVGVLEHVGYKNYANLMKLARSMIKPEGIFLLHSIGGNVSINFCEPWINKYIFPRGMLPSLKQLGKAFEKHFVVEDWQNFGAYYEKTLLSWHENFNQHWPALINNYDERFRRMMNYYLLSCAGGFKARGMQLWQFVLSPNGILNGYNSIR